ncbi:hypothetical protein GCM10023149_43640 [Mucilaginibacter gynuensis]|uniref:Uncharacterized protein n=1 Tax=Mucilaginibacter gynuensis TaxID=1302236 RepID=A0ABP8H7Q7_9SPHI
MKKILFVILLLSGLTTQAQKIIQLDDLSVSDTLLNDKAIIYGNFIQRLKFSSGGFPQDIRLKDTLTKNIYAFRVKPTFKSAKENLFCYYLPPGTYQLLNYWYTESKWYGGKVFTEGILSTANKPLFVTVKPNKIYYLGDWHFETTNHFFVDQKATCDSLLKKRNVALKLETALTTLPTDSL